MSKIIGGIAGCAGQMNCKPFSDVPFIPTTVMELDDGECPYHHNEQTCRMQTCICN